MFDVFLLPSLFEGAPVSAIEAQASGLRCIMSDTITKSIDILACGYISIKEEPVEFAKAIDKMIVDDDYRNEAYDKIIAAGFDLRTETTKLEEYYYNMRY